MSSWARQWHPADSEDQRTAMVFGFFKHAPPSLALIPWLERMLPPPVEAEVLDVSHFWPSYQRDGGRVVPDLCFTVTSEGRRVAVVVEAKRTVEEHTLDQLLAEASAAAQLPDPEHILLVTVGSRLAGRDHSAELSAHAGMEVLHRHVPWAHLGDILRGVPERDEAWGRYALDIWNRMRGLGLLNDPVLPNPGVSAVEAFAAVNEFSIRARDFLKVVRAEVAEPLHLQLPPRAGFWRTGVTEAPGWDERWWTQGVMYTSWRLSSWADPQRVFVAIDMRAPDGPEILVGPAWAPNGELTLLMVVGDPHHEAENESLKARANTFTQRLAHQAAAGLCDFRFNRRRWSVDTAADIAWVGEQVKRAVAVAKDLTDDVVGASPPDEPTLIE